MNSKELWEQLRKGFDENDRLVAAQAKKLGVKIDMGDKQQLAAMGEHMAEQAGQSQPLCMAKRIEELEVQMRGLKSANLSWQAEIEELDAKFAAVRELLREATEWMEDHPSMPDSSRMRAALSGKLPEPAAPEGWQLVPVDATMAMIDAAILVDEDGYHAMYSAMLAAAPKPDAAK